MSGLYSASNNNSDMSRDSMNPTAVWSDWDAKHESSHIQSPEDNSFNSTRSSHNLRGTRGYAANDHFADSRFISEDESERGGHLQEQNDFSSIVYNDDSHNSLLRSPVGTSSSMENSIRKYSDDPFDTVQQRHKSSNRTTVEDPEYLAYLRGGKKQQLHSQMMNQDDLIVKGIGEVSGEVYNTFKNKKPQSKRNGTTSMTKNNFSNSSIGTVQSGEYDSSNETSNEVLRDANNVYNGMISRNNNNSTNFVGKLGNNKLPLITPEAVGLNFQNVVGEWVMNKDETTSQDISANHTVADISSSTATQPQQQAPPPPPPINSISNKNKNKNKRQILNDTPLPFKIKNILPVETDNDDDDERVDLQLVHKLTPILMNRDWNKLTYLDASNLKLNNVIGLNICFPELISCNLSNNDIKIFDLVHCIPSKLIELNLSNNLMNENYLSNDGIQYNNNIKLLNLSNNRFNSNLSWLNEFGYDKFPNLQKLILHGNKIKSLIGMPKFSTIERIDLSNNNITGIIDFKELISGGPYEKFGWNGVTELDLSGNGITKIYNLHYLKSLRRLNLNGNPLASIHLTELSQMNNLIDLQILCNELISIGNNEILPFPNLQTLKISCYKGLKDIKKMPSKLTQLSIRDGEVTNLIPWERIPGSLQTLEITNITGLKELPQDSMTELWFTSLQEINLQDNDLFSWANLIYFLPFVHLKTLRLDGNDRLLYDQGRPDRSRLEPELRSLLKRSIPSLELVTL